MDLSSTLAEISTLSVNDRIRLVQAIWESIASEPDQIELTEVQQQELLRRLENHRTNPSAVVSWESVKTQALARARVSE
jgi:putative addiction module component (TIGR02574 family)